MSNLEGIPAHFVMLGLTLLEDYWQGGIVTIAGAFDGRGYKIIWKHPAVRTLTPIPAQLAELKNYGWKWFEYDVEEGDPPNIEGEGYFYIE